MFEEVGGGWVSSGGVWRRQGKKICVGLVVKRGFRGV